MQALKTVYLVRHGQSEANIAPVFQSPDSPLSEKGTKQAEEIADRLQKISFDKLISSPFPRAKQTAEIIAKTTKHTPEFSDLFIERFKPTSINNKPYTDSEASNIFNKWEESLFNSKVHVEDGENFDDIVLRADRALDFLGSKKEESMTVVSHGFFIRILIARVVFRDNLTGSMLKDLHIRANVENTGISVIKYGELWDGSITWRLWIFNDHAHLG